MLNRQTLISIHVLISSFFLPFLFLLPLSGGLYLLKETGSQEKTPVFSFTDAIPSETKEMEAFFREQFQKNNIDFEFEYVRISGNDFIFRPSSRVHYVANKSVDGLTNISKVDPNFLKRIMEIHKGHGPGMIKWVEIAFAVALILVTISGLWLALTVRTYRQQVVIAFLIGSALIIAALV